MKSSVLYTLNFRVIEKKLPQVFPSNEMMRVKRRHLIAVDVDEGSVHGNVLRQTDVPPGGAVDDVCGPGVVVVAGTPDGARHQAVTGNEVTALTQSKAM